MLTAEDEDKKRTKSVMSDSSEVGKTSDRAINDDFGSLQRLDLPLIDGKTEAEYRQQAEDSNVLLVWNCDAAVQDLPLFDMPARPVIAEPNSGLRESPEHAYHLSGNDLQDPRKVGDALQSELLKCVSAVGSAALNAIPCNSTNRNDKSTALFELSIAYDGADDTDEG